MGCHGVVETFGGFYKPVLWPAERAGITPPQPAARLAEQVTARAGCYAHGELFRRMKREQEGAERVLREECGRIGGDAAAGLCRHFGRRLGYEMPHGLAELPTLAAVLGTLSSEVHPRDRVGPTRTGTDAQHSLHRRLQAAVATASISFRSMPSIKDETPQLRIHDVALRRVGGPGDCQLCCVSKVDQLHRNVFQKGQTPLQAAPGRSASRR